MTNTKLILPLAVVLLALVIYFRPATTQPAAQAPKASAVIDASRFPNLQAAFDAVPESGGVVRIPPGKYEITKPLIVTREDIRIEGVGTSSHIINKNTDGEPALILRPKAKFIDVKGKKRRAKIWRVQLANFRITGNKQSGDGVHADSVNEIFIHGMSVERNGGHGIHLVECYEDPRVADCLITYNAKAGLNIIAGHDIVVNGNQFEENQDAVRCIDSFNLCMNGNNLDDHLRHGVVIENTYGSVVAGNMIEECNGTAIVIDRDCYGITLSANVIAHNMEGGIDLKDAWGSTVSANTFTIVMKRAVVVGPNSGRITITGNNFSNSHIGGKVRREDAATGVTLQGTSDITISGNTFTGLSGPAVRADDACQRIAVVGNVMHELHRGKGKGQALELGGAKAVLVENNVGAK